MQTFGIKFKMFWWVGIRWGREFVSGQKPFIGHTTQYIKLVDKEEISEIAKPWIFINLFFSIIQHNLHLLQSYWMFVLQGIRKPWWTTAYQHLLFFWIPFTTALQLQAESSRQKKNSYWNSFLVWCCCQWYWFQWELHLPLLWIYFTWKAHNSCLRFWFKNFEGKLGRYQRFELLYITNFAIEKINI